MKRGLERDAYQALKRLVLERDGWKCRNCGARQNLHVHHVLFRSHGGLDEDRNMLTVCFTCHDDVHGRNSKKKLDIAQGDGPVDANQPLRFVVQWKGLLR